MTQQALTPAPTYTVAVAAAAQPTSFATLVPAVTPYVTSAPTALPALAATPPAVSTAAPADLPTPTPDQAAEIAVAYGNYFDVTGQALLNLDATPLDQVAAGQSLAGLEQTIEEDRAQGRALQTNVQHEQVYVLDVQDH